MKPFRGFALLIAAWPGHLHAQAPVPPQFDTVAIRPNPQSQPFPSLHVTARGVRATGITLRGLLQDAYGIPDASRIIGGPAWLDTDHFDIVASVDLDAPSKANGLSSDVLRGMLQNMLADRFRIQVHHERRSFPIFQLTVAPGGSKLRDAKLPAGVAPGSVGGQLRRRLPGKLTVVHTSTTTLAITLSAVAGRIVQDHTGLAGRYDVSLEWTPEDAVLTPSPIDPFNGAPPLPKAIEEQLGLRLKPATEPLDVVVVDHAEQPTPN